MSEQPEAAVLTPTEKRTLQAALAKCQSCRQIQDYLDQLGQPDKELRERLDHLQQLSEKALELDRQARR